LGEKATNLFFNKIKSPAISFYYRGEKVTFPVPVYTNFVRLEAVPVAGGDQITVDLRQRDNDHQADNASAFGKMIKVNAVFQAYSDPSLEAPFEITYLSSTTEATSTAGVPGFKNTPSDSNDPYKKYSMDFGVAKYGTTPWGVANSVKNGATKAVKVYYASPLGATVATRQSYPTITVDSKTYPHPASTINERTRNASVMVEWTNVPQ